MKVINFLKNLPEYIRILRQYPKHQDQVNEIYRLEILMESKDRIIKQLTDDFDDHLDEATKDYRRMVELELRYIHKRYEQLIEKLNDAK